MNNFITCIFFVFISLLSSLAYCEKIISTNRVSKISNEAVDVWETTIIPGKNNELKMHRHEKDRIIVAQTDGLLKVTSNKGETHDLKLKKGGVYYLSKDKAGELHDDKNLTNKPIKVLVIELKNS